MADPISELAGAPKTKPRSKVWAERGVARNATQAKKRVAASRRSRPKPKPKTPLCMNAYVGLANAIEAIAVRHDVSRAQVLKRIIEDGVRKYGNADEVEEAGLVAYPDRTFDEMPAEAPVNPIPTTPFNPYMQMPAGPPLIPYTPPNFPGQTTTDAPVPYVPGMTAGPPLPSSYPNGPQTSIEDLIEDESE